MDATGCRKPWVALAAVLVGYAGLAAAVQVRCADLLSSDGECYLRMAAYYARGDFRHAIFGHWSPLGGWLMVPAVAAGMAPRVAMRIWIGLWGATAVVGVWRLAGRFDLKGWLRTAVTACAALLAVEFSADHRVDLLLAALLLLYLDAAMDERLLSSRRWALGAGALGGAAYLAKLYALPFFAAHFTIIVLLRGRASRATWTRRTAGAWLLGVAGFAAVAAPWATVLSVKLGHATLGTAAGTSYALVGPGSGDARQRAIQGLRKPPPDAYNVWQDATQDAARPEQAAPSPLSSGEALMAQLRVAWRNAGLIAAHLASADRLHLGLAALVLTALAWPLTRGRERRFQYAAVLSAVVVFCGGYALIQAENRRYFWFVFLALAVLAFHLAALLPALVGRRRTAPRWLAVLVALVVLASFAWRPVQVLAELLGGPPLGRQHRVVAAQLTDWGVRGPLASLGGRGWWDGLHTAYFLDAKYAGAPLATTAPDLAAEMRAAGATTLLVWGQPHWPRALGADPAFELLGPIPSADVHVFRLVTPPSGQTPPGS